MEMREHIEAIQRYRRQCLIFSLDAHPTAALRLDIAIQDALAACDDGGWRKMEMAPTDGTPIASIYANAVFPLLSLEAVRWVEDDLCGGWCDESGNEIHPTHWIPLPLPLPPKEA